MFYIGYETRKVCHMANIQPVERLIHPRKILHVYVKIEQAGLNCVVILQSLFTTFLQFNYSIASDVCDKQPCLTHLMF